MKSRLCLTLLALLVSGGVLPAEDWTTSDGKIYRDVIVVKTEPDAVTIIHRDGGALVPLVKLPADLQKRFHYDPIAAQEAADARAKSDAANALALQIEISETTELEKKVQARQMMEQRAARAYFQALSNSYHGSDLSLELMDSKLFANGDVWGHLKSDPTPHYQISDLLKPDPLSQSASTSPQANIGKKATGPEQNAPAPDNLSGQLNASKIRLIGKVRSAVAGGYILGGISQDDHYQVEPDPSRPDYELLSDQTPGGGIFLYTRCTTYSENQILDVDVYPMSKYTSTSGETIPAFTTSASSARACLALKQHD
jgi:hypothetical protein